MNKRKNDPGDERSSDSAAGRDGRRIRVFIVDDHPMVRVGLAGLFVDQPGFCVCGEADSFEDALRKIPAAGPDIVMIDLALGARSGFDLLRALRTDHPTLRALVLTSYDEAKYAMRAIREGASGYLMKSASMEEILAAVRRAFRGDIVVGEAVRQQYLSEIANETGMPHASQSQLSQREQQIYDALGEGLGQKEMAQRFRLSIKTVGCYCDRIKAKLNFTRLREVMRAARESRKSKGI